MEQKETNVKVPLISKIAYGMGDVGCNFSWMFVGNFLMIFYTDVFGIGMGAVATLMLLSRFWDAINDPVIGALSDKTYTRWGRYRPWLLIAAPLTALVLIMTFWAHPYILYPCAGLYLRQYSVRDALRRNDAEYGRTCKDQYIPFCERDDRHRSDQYYHGSAYLGSWRRE